MTKTTSKLFACSFVLGLCLIAVGIIGGAILVILHFIIKYWKIRSSIDSCLEHGCQDAKEHPEMVQDADRLFTLLQA